MQRERTTRSIRGDMRIYDLIGPTKEIDMDNCDERLRLCIAVLSGLTYASVNPHQKAYERKHPGTLFRIPCFLHGKCLPWMVGDCFGTRAYI